MPGSRHVYVLIQINKVADAHEYYTECVHSDGDCCIQQIRKSNKDYRNVYDEP